MYSQFPYVAVVFLWCSVTVPQSSSSILGHDYVLSAPVASHSTCGPSPDKHLVCHLRPGDAHCDLSALDPCLCTHLVYGQVTIQDDLSLSDVHYANLTSVGYLREQNPQMITLVEVQGLDTVSVIPTEQQLTTLSEDIWTALEPNIPDGLDINWGFTDVDSQVAVQHKPLLTSFVQHIREVVHEEEDGYPTLSVTLSRHPQILAAGYNYDQLAEYVDFVNLPAFMFDHAQPQYVAHPAPLHGITENMDNTDSLVDLVLSMGLPKEKLVLGVPMFGVGYRLANPHLTAPGEALVVEQEAPYTFNHPQYCILQHSLNLSVVRDVDQTAPYAVSGDAWLGFDDELSLKLKGKYVLLRDLGGAVAYDLNDDDYRNICSEGHFPLLHSLHDGLTGAVAQPIIETESVPLTPTHTEAKIVNIIDQHGNHLQVDALNTYSVSGLTCTRQGFYRHPDDCTQFYRCVKFNQQVEDYTVFMFDCPTGLVFDERIEVCNWPSWSPPCYGSGEVLSTPRSSFICPGSGYYQDPENCRWFYFCSDVFENGTLTPYNFKCPYDLGYNPLTYSCNYRAITPGCGYSGVVQEALFGPSLQIPSEVYTAGHVTSVHAGHGIPVSTIVQTPLVSTHNVQHTVETPVIHVVKPPPVRTVIHEVPVGPSAVPTFVHRPTPAPEVIHHEEPVPAVIHLATPAPAIVHHDAPVPAVVHVSTPAPAVVHVVTPPPAVVHHPAPAPEVVHVARPAPAVVHVVTPPPAVVHHSAPAPEVVHVARPAPAVVHVATPPPAVVQHSAPAPEVVHVARPAPAIVHHATQAPAVVHVTTPAPTVVHVATPAPAVVHHELPTPAVVHHPASNPVVIHVTTPAPTVVHHAAPAPAIVHHAASPPVRVVEKIVSPHFTLTDQHFSAPSPPVKTIQTLHASSAQEVIQPVPEVPTHYIKSPFHQGHLKAVQPIIYKQPHVPVIQHVYNYTAPAYPAYQVPIQYLPTYGQVHPGAFPSGPSVIQPGQQLIPAQVPYIQTYPYYTRYGPDRSVYNAPLPHIRPAVVQQIPVLGSTYPSMYEYRILNGKTLVTGYTQNITVIPHGLHDAATKKVGLVNPVINPYTETLNPVPSVVEKPLIETVVIQQPGEIPSVTYVQKVPDVTCKCTQEVNVLPAAPEQTHEVEQPVKVKETSIVSKLPHEEHTKILQSNNAPVGITVEKYEPVHRDEVLVTEKKFPLNPAVVPIQKNESVDYDPPLYKELPPVPTSQPEDFRRQSEEFHRDYGIKKVLQETSTTTLASIDEIPSFSYGGSSGRKTDSRADESFNYEPPELDGYSYEKFDNTEGGLHEYGKSQIPSPADVYNRPTASTKNVQRQHTVGSSRNRKVNNYRPLPTATLPEDSYVTVQHKLEEANRPLKEIPSPTTSTPSSRSPIREGLSRNRSEKRISFNGGAKPTSTAPTQEPQLPEVKRPTPVSSTFVRSKQIVSSVQNSEPPPAGSLRHQTSEQVSSHSKSGTGLIPDTACTREGLFRHPSDCSKFYECYFDKWINKYTVHVFRCPVKLAFNPKMSACGSDDFEKLCQDKE